PPLATASPYTTLFRSRNGRGRHTVANRLVVQLNRSAATKIALVDASNDLEGFRAARANQSKNTGDLAFEDREGVVANDVAHRDRSEEHTSELQSREKL